MRGQVRVKYEGGAVRDRTTRGQQKQAETANSESEKWSGNTLAT